MGNASAEAYEPLKRYGRQLREAHRKVTEACLQKLLAQAKVDEQANQQLVRGIHKLEATVQSSRRQVSFWNVLFGILLIGSILLVVSDIVGLVRVFGEMQAPFDRLLVGCLLATPLAIFLTVLTAKRQRAVQQALEAHEQALEAHLQAAWEQMAPLNALLRWELSPELIRKTTDLFEIDTFSSRSREHFFRTTPHAQGLLYPHESVTFTMSGTVHGAPYLFLEGRRWQWEPKVYEGFLTIHWTERVRDARGRSRVVTRTQTLVATVEKPAPVFYTEARLLYSSPYAPLLSFSREPSKYSKPELSFWERIGKRWQQRKLEKLSRNLTDGSDYTMMNNTEFETLFCTANRNDEQGFRVLFTPLAQVWMLNLLRDKKIAFGDDFIFEKDQTIITITPAHLQEFSPEADVVCCRSYDLNALKATFVAFEERYFKGFFASFMPVLSIPLHQMPQANAKNRDPVPGEWFVASLANAYRESFTPPRCTTEFVLTCREETSKDFEVEAQGFYTKDHVAFVARLGGDGRMHEVPVPWKEYLVTKRVRRLRVEPQTEALKDALLYRGFAGVLQ